MPDKHTIAFRNWGQDSIIAAPGPADAPVAALIFRTEDWLRRKWRRYFQGYLFRCVKEDESITIEAGTAQTTRYTLYPV